MLASMFFGPLLCSAPFLGGCFGYFFNFSARGRGRGSPGRHGGQGVGFIENSRRGGVYMSKDGSIWQLFVLCLLALGDTVPKCFVLLQFGTLLEREKLPNGPLPPPPF